MLVCKTCGVPLPITTTNNRIFCCDKCKYTYHNRTKRGLPLTGYISIYNGPADKRFWMRIDKNGPIPKRCPELGPCWLWKGKVDSNGYGQLQVNKKTIRTNRFSYELHVGPIPLGYEICHKCDNPSCANPVHLWADTHKNNMRDCWKKGRFNSVVNFSLLNDTNLDLLSTEQLQKIISNAQQEIKRREGVKGVL